MKAGLTGRVCFTIYGKPQPGGSKSAFVIKGTNRAVVTDANKNLKPWQAEVKDKALEAVGDAPLLEGPLFLQVKFVLERPKTVTRARPTVKPDATKLLRGLEDALTGIVYRDDAQIVEQHVYKHYGERACAEVIVGEIETP